MLSTTKFSLLAAKFNGRHAPLVVDFNVPIADHGADAERAFTDADVDEGSSHSPVGLFLHRGDLFASNFLVCGGEVRSPRHEDYSMALW